MEGQCGNQGRCGDARLKRDHEVAGDLGGDYSGQRL